MAIIASVRSARYPRMENKVHRRDGVITACSLRSIGSGSPRMSWAPLRGGVSLRSQAKHPNKSGANPTGRLLHRSSPVLLSLVAMSSRQYSSSPRPVFHDRPVTRALVGVALGLGVSLSCGGGGGGGGCGGASCPPSGGTCDACQTGENLYTCAIQGTNNWICTIDDFTADQHCAAIGSVVQSKTTCSSVGDTGGEQRPPPSDDETANVDGSSTAGSEGQAKTRGR